MEEILAFLRTDLFLLILSLGLVIVIILYITNFIKLSKLRKSYQQFMKKLGKGEGIDEILKKYIKDVEILKENQEELKNYCNKINTQMDLCVQKIGIVRYSAFKDTGSDLSFTLALLDNYNTGVVLNGIYSREMSNIYAKPIKEGKSVYTLSSEEKEAIEKAISIDN